MARRILVVEDEAPIREMVCFVLEQNGYQPIEADDYDAAIAWLVEPFPDLVLLDWMIRRFRYSGYQTYETGQSVAGNPGDDADSAR